MFDKDGDGNISVQEVHESLASLGFHVEPSGVKLMVKHVDTDGTYTTGFSNQCVILLATITHTHTRLTALFPGVPSSAGTRKVKPIWILLEQETVSGSGISWAICKSASRCRQITMPVPHHSVFYRPDALPAAQPTVSKH